MDDSLHSEGHCGEVIGLDFEPEDIHVMRLNETEEEFDARIEEYVEVEEQEAGLINAIEEERDEEKQPLIYLSSPISCGFFSLSWLL